MSAEASVIVRVKDEARTIERTLQSLRRQTVQPEIIVVDSGSRDGSLEIAKRYCDQLIQIRPEEFTYGRALNIGANAASAPVHFALSAHCWPERNDWIERSLAHYSRPDVAGTNGETFFADFTPLREPFYQDAAHARSNPFWGFSNHASSWRAATWEQFPFDEEIDYAEDREWSWRVLDAGWVIVYDPALWVSLEHSWKGGMRDIYNRQRRAQAAIASFAPLPPYRLRDMLHEWWFVAPDKRHSMAFHRVNPLRFPALIGKYVGRRQGLAAKSSSPARSEPEPGAPEEASELRRGQRQAISGPAPHPAGQHPQHVKGAEQPEPGSAEDIAGS
jgi:rhamnosyltransferase